MPRAPFGGLVHSLIVLQREMSLMRKGIFAPQISSSTIFHIVAREISLLHQLDLGGNMFPQDVLPLLLLTCPFPGCTWGAWWL